MFKKMLTAIALCLFTISVYAAPSPIPMLQTVAKQMIKELEANKVKLRRDPEISYKIVTKVLLPHVDQYRMARSVVNRIIWDKANAKERSAFITQFRRLVIKTYASAFSDYSNETVKIFPIRGAVGNDVQVKSEVVRPGKPSVPVTYRLAYKNGKWKVYDFSVEGISMIQSFRSQFAAMSQNGLQPLTLALQRHNQMNQQ